MRTNRWSYCPLVLSAVGVSYLRQSSPFGEPIFVLVSCRMDVLLHRLPFLSRLTRRRRRMNTLRLSSFRLTVFLPMRYLCTRLFVGSVRLQQRPGRSPGLRDEVCPGHRYIQEQAICPRARQAAQPRGLLSVSSNASHAICVILFLLCASLLGNYSPCGHRAVELYSNRPLKRPFVQ